MSGCIGASMDSRYSGTRRGTGGIRGHLEACRGVGAIWGYQGV